MMDPLTTEQHEIFPCHGRVILRRVGCEFGQ
jgi:hypothetical protein